LIENVKLLTSMKDPDGRYVRDRVIETYQQLGYDSQFYVVNAKNYGVAQHRERVIFIGVRSDLKLNPSIPDHMYSDESISLFNDMDKPFTFGDAVSDLVYIESGEKVDNDPYHWAVSHPNHVLEWMVDVPQGRSAHDNEDPSLRPPSGYNTTYKRQVWDEPAGTVATTFGMISGCRNVHPIATRSMTIREALRLQSFPDSFKMTGTAGTKRTVIGNAVPPMLGYQLAKHIVDSYIS
jgi:DNA (cytosine-5)-methyltransferase 1